jgi:hypothetical protein
MTARDGGAWARVWRELHRWGRELPAAINRRLRPIGRSRREASHPRHLGVARGFEPTTAYGGRAAHQIDQRTSDELIAEAKNELAILKAKSKGPAPAKGRNRPGHHRSSVPDPAGRKRPSSIARTLARKNANVLQLPSRPCAAIAGTNRRDRAFEALCPAPYSLDSSASHF